MSVLNIKWSPIEYAEAAVIAKEAEEGMLNRLAWMTLKPSMILDLGCGSGEMAKRLHVNYPKAQIFAVDVAEIMLAQTKPHASVIKPICADAANLPFADQTFDLIMANFLLPWHHDINALLKENKRVLKPDGLLMLSALGPDTLQSWRNILGGENFPRLIDMHDIGDVLIQQGFADPVLDVDYFTLVYRDQEKLIRELKASGMLVENDEKRLFSVPSTSKDEWHLTYEVVFAHAFTPSSNDEFSASSSGEVRVPLSHLRRKLHEKY